MQGVVREGLKVPMAELESHFPGQAREVMEAVAQALAEVTPAVFGMVEIAGYGIAVQQQYAQSVHAWLRLLESDAIRQTPRHIERLHQLLAQVANAWNDKSWFRRTTPKARYDEVRAEVDHLVALLTSHEAAVLQARLAVQQAMAETGDCIRRAMGYQMASEYLSTILPPDKAGGLMDRSLSLANTVALLQAQQMQMQQQDRQLGRMMNAIREGVLVALPAWTMAVITSETADMNETRQFMLKDQLTAVLYKLTNQ